MSEQNLLYSDVTKRIIGSAIEVHTVLGAGFLESVYENALAIEFDLCNLKYERQMKIEVFYKGKHVKQFICDFVVENKVLVELKALKQLTEIEYAQTLNYLKAAGYEVGLLINFGGNSLQHKRFIKSKSV